MSELDGPIRTAYIISGGGTNMEAAALASKEGGVLHGLFESALVLSSDPNAGGIAKAKALGIPTQTIKFGGKKGSVTAQMKDYLGTYGVQFCVLAGYTKLIPMEVVNMYDGRMINIHPAPLDPAYHKPDMDVDFGGRGMYGLPPHIAVVAYAAITGDLKGTAGVSHIVTPRYDEGGLIRRVYLPFPFEVPRMTFEEIVAKPDEIVRLAKVLQQALLPLEWQNLIETLEVVAHSERGNIPTIKRGGRLIASQYLSILGPIKQLAIELARLENH